MKGYWDSFDCEIQCEEFYHDEYDDLDYEDEDYPPFEYVEDPLDDWPF